MIRIISEGRVYHHVEYDLSFDTSKNGGYAFPCNHKGEVFTSELTPEGLKNYERCVSGEVVTLRPAYVKESARTEYVAPVGECFCGAEVELTPDSEGLCYCHCGQTYNTAGQSIRPRSEWEERYEDDY